MTKFTELSLEQQEWFMKLVEGIVTYCEGGNNTSIVVSDKGGPTIYGVASNTSNEHAALFEWLANLSKQGIDYHDSAVLRRLSHFYFDEYASHHPLLAAAVASMNYALAWLLLNFYMWGFKTGEVISITQNCVEKLLSVINILKYNDMERATLQNFVYSIITSNTEIGKLFCGYLTYNLLTNIKFVDVVKSANKYNSLSNGIIARFYKNFVPITYYVFGDKGVDFLSPKAAYLLRGWENYKEIYGN